MSKPLKPTEMRARIAMLEKIVTDTLWMARRYAHGRQTYAVGLYNGAARTADCLGLTESMPDGSIFALDGTRDGAGSADMSDLSQAEFDAAVAALNAKGITEHPDRFSPAGRRCLPAPTPSPDTTGANRGR